MPCVDSSNEFPSDPLTKSRAATQSGLSLALLAASLLTLLSACSTAPSKPPGVDASLPKPSAPVDVRPTPMDKPAPKTLPPSALSLPPPKPVNNVDALRRQAAERLVAANPKQTYTGQAPEILLAIPVLEIELYRDGSVRHIQVLRHPGQARDTTQLAMDAVYRAAPFGDVSRMPRPWKFTETFLFNDDRRFKPRSLD